MMGVCTNKLFFRIRHADKGEVERGVAPSLMSRIAPTALPR
jgi:hypothetical protein